MLFPNDRKIFVDGQELWDLILTTVLTVSECRIDDMAFMEWFCAFTSVFLGGFFMQLWQHSPHDVVSGRRKIWNLFHHSTNPAAAYLPRGKRFYSNACVTVKKCIQHINEFNFCPGALSPRRWQLLQRLACLHLSSKEVLPVYSVSLICGLASFPGSSDLLVDPVVASLASISAEELEQQTLVPFIRLLILIPWMSQLGSWMKLIGAIVQLLSRVDKVDMTELESWQNRMSLFYKGMSMNWKGPQPAVTQLCVELHPLATVSTSATEASIEVLHRDTTAWFEMLGTLINHRIKDQLLAKFLDFTLALYNHNTLGHVRMTPNTAQEILNLLRDSLNPTVKSFAVRLLEEVFNAESLGLHFARPIQLLPSDLPLLCVTNGPHVPDVLEPPPIRLASSTDAPQTVFVWESRPAPSEAVHVAGAFANADNLAAMIESFLQVLRTDGADNSKDLTSASAAFGVLAAVLGPRFLLPAFKERLLVLAASQVEEEITFTLSLIRGLLFDTWRWPTGDLPALWAFLLPILDVLVDTERMSASKLDLILVDPLGDPRRMAPLWDHLLCRLERAEPDLNQPATELLATLLHLLIKCCSGWRMAAVRRRFDAVMQTIVARTTPSPRHSRLVERWLALSVTVPAKARLLMAPGGDQNDLEQPRRWLQQLVAIPSAGEATTEGEMPERLRRLYYLCPIDVESMKQALAFFEILTDNLKEILLTRGSNFALSDEASNFANQRIATLTLAVLARVGVPKDVAKVFAPVDEVLSSEESPTRSLCFALSLLRQLLCRNVALLQPDMTDAALRHCCRHLGSEQQPVVRAAEQALAELLCRGVLCSRTLLAHLAAETVTPAAEAHALGALLEAFPHSLPQETAQVVARLDVLLTLDRSLRPFVEKIIRNFLRAHQDAWEERWKRQLPSSTQNLLLRLSGSGSYFS